MRGLKIWEQLFLFISTVNILATIGLTIARLVIIIDVEKNPESPDFTYAVVLLINSCESPFFVIGGNTVNFVTLYRKNYFLDLISDAHTVVILTFGYYPNGLNVGAYLNVRSSGRQVWGIRRSSASPL